MTADPVAARGPATPRDDVLAAAKDHLAGTTALLAPDRIGGRVHLQAALDQARRALDADRDRVRDPALEVLLHAAGTDQIEQALERVGLGETVEALVVAPIREDGGVEAFLAGIGFERDDALLDADAERVAELARGRGHPATAEDAVDWLIEDAALVGLE